MSWPYLRRNIHACRSRDPNKLLFCEEADFAFLRFTSVSVVLSAAEHTLSHEIMLRFRDGHHRQTHDECRVPEQDAHEGQKVVRSDRWEPLWQLAGAAS